jgi:hypothetical protein
MTNQVMVAMLTILKEKILRSQKTQGKILFRTKMILRVSLQI